MFNIFRKEIDWGGRPLVLESGRIARQADGAVVVTYGDTVVLCTAVGANEPREGIDFFPLTVNYQEKTFAAGKIPGGFFKREGRPSEKETLTSRLIDRPIRPLFAKGYRNETQVICTVLSHDLENNPDIAAMIGTSAALTISGLPFLGPIGGCRVGYKDGEYLLNPRQDELPSTQLDLIVAGTREGVLMVESEAQELSEEVMLGAVTFGHEQMQPVIDLIISLAEDCAKEPLDVPAPAPEVEAVRERLSQGIAAQLAEAYQEPDKMLRHEKVGAAKEAGLELLGDDSAAVAVAPGVLKALESEIVRGNILKTRKRIDGRTTADVRPIVCEVGVLPLTHGSALFTRGETQALVTTTLGTGQDEQIIDALEGDYREYFMLHYNFPPY
ncbi:MAG: polyribonucleotide nucleotidyltransferase, partial [Rhodospirillales bacterium]|nr:polyribonucleotide nucleotidyltransferase [Rhodospirillales bacterium]